MKKTLTAAVAAAAVLTTAPAIARDVNVEITNLTSGIYFTPLLVAAHDRKTHLFQAGTEASDELQAMAEGGSLDGLIGVLESAGAKYEANPAGGFLPPGESASASIKLHRRHSAYLSVVAMMLPTNDGFVGLDSMKIPAWRGTYTYYLNGYDAGTEDNDEKLVGMAAGAPGVPGVPGDPGGFAGSGADGVEIPEGAENPMVHVHRGVLGDTDNSDLDSRVHRWLNPVARVVVKVR